MPQIVMCIKAIIEVGALVGSTYTMTRRFVCSKTYCKSKAIEVVELKGLPNGDRPFCAGPGEWLPDDHFIPLNDPDMKKTDEPEYTEKPKDVTKIPETVK